MNTLNIIEMIMSVSCIFIWSFLLGLESSQLKPDKTIITLDLVIIVLLYIKIIINMITFI